MSSRVHRARLTALLDVEQEFVLGELEVGFEPGPVVVTAEVAGSAAGSWSEPWLILVRVRGSGTTNKQPQPRIVQLSPSLPDQPQTRVVVVSPWTP